MRGDRSTPTHQPIMAAYLAAAAESTGNEVEVIDACIDAMSPEQVAQRCKEVEADVIAIVPYEYRRELPLDTTLAVTEALERLHPRAQRGLLNGVEAEQMAVLKDAVTSGHVDWAAFGDSEHAFIEILQGDPAKSTPVGVFRQTRAGEVIDGGLREADGLDSLPFPAWHLFRHDAYAISPHRYRRLPILPVLASRACPYKCDYCPQALFNTKQRHQVRSAESVVEEIQWLVAQYGVREIEFYDPTFATRRRDALELCRLLKAAGTPVSWSCNSRCDLLDDELVREMAAAGCQSILFGIENGTQAIVDASGKNLSLEDVRAGMALCKQHGIETIASFVIGLPGETPATVESTIQFSIELDPTYAQFHICRAFYDHPRWLAAGRLKDEWDIGDESFNGRLYIPEAFESEEELKSLHRQAYRRFYARPRYIAARLRKLGSAEELRRLAAGGAMLLRQMSLSKKENLTVQ